MTPVPTVLLNNGRSIPQLGFGVFLVPPDETAQVTAQALRVGYRHIDTAEMYGNEKQVGQALTESGLKRDEVYVTSKLDNGYHEPDEARRAFDATLAALGIDQIDLFLIHWPLPTRYGGDFVSTWRTLEEFYRDGRARSIGVSNFHEHHLRRLFDETDVVPAVNQIEVHPWLPQNELRAFCAEHRIAVEAWSPLARGALLDDPTISEIASRLRRTPAQVALRWHIERGDIVFPKSTRPERIAENFAIFDFSLDEDDVAAISALDCGRRIGPDPEIFDRI
jgi:2,5-diketo-D-gluconate reductase A